MNKETNIYIPEKDRAAIQHPCFPTVLLPDTPLALRHSNSQIAHLTQIGNHNCFSGNPIYRSVIDTFFKPTKEEWKVWRATPNGSRSYGAHWYGEEGKLPTNVATLPSEWDPIVLQDADNSPFFRRIFAYNLLTTEKEKIKAKEEWAKKRKASRKQRRKQGTYDDDDWNGDDNTDDDDEKVHEMAWNGAHQKSAFDFFWFVLQDAPSSTRLGWTCESSFAETSLWAPMFYAGSGLWASAPLISGTTLFEFLRTHAPAIAKTKFRDQKLNGRYGVLEERYPWIHRRPLILSWSRLPFPRLFPEHIFQGILEFL